VYGDIPEGFEMVIVPLVVQFAFAELTVPSTTSITRLTNAVSVQPGVFAATNL
jgi:hypothetical protein